MVVGGGGREHAIVRALTRFSGSPELICTPGNAGIAREARCLQVDAEDVEGVLLAAREEAAELVIVGPEAPLVDGLVDRLEQAGIPAFGPSAEAARLEGSKAHAKAVMAEAGVPTASHTVLRSEEEALGQIACARYPCVLKADGLAAGKGVIICESEAEAREAVQAFFIEERFGATEVVLEDFLEGEELSLLAICDGENVVPLAPAQDYKRIGDGDTGPNTGGMGSYSPVPGFEDIDELVDSVHRPVVDLLARRGTPFHGVLYAGLIMTAVGPKVLEFNCRFGDPETQAVLPRLQSDLAELCLASREPGGLASITAEFSDDWAVTVVLASAGYPGSSSKGDMIRGLDRAAGIAEVFHAGTAEENGEIVTAGGRVLAVTGLGAAPTDARQRAYDAASAIDFDGMQMRTDIALRAVERVAAG
ncbi:MAG: phosphoribosylamine--glycine ligase [Solirubrobacterales bacterium]